MIDYRSIKVTKGKGKVKILTNPSSYELIGKGCQGAVFKLSEDRCVKVFASSKHRSREESVLRMAKGSSFFPKFYEAGEYYIVMELVKGKTLEQFFLEGNKIPIEMTKQIVHLIKDLKRLNIPRRDPKLRHMILTENNKIKLIDHVNSLNWTEQPEKLFSGLEKLGLLETFLKQVEEIENELYLEWKHIMKKKFK
ncbi:hypothetical protein DS745_22435 [Anaerobacillus alkaliphilus]|uniref:Serine/threonine protein kinase n=1 Tax=Anaerobacillus alkaliphilus TaxID=1548597 RepID=A0A4Q0VM36_9BACI|nr:hypothetical protein [Anaerobacillus alkaliphilus]RXI96471.1 hypothetical protein DS745_22435 [Anaerobacillus alkaliphilus]